MPKCAGSALLSYTEEKEDLSSDLTGTTEAIGALLHGHYGHHPNQSDTMTPCPALYCHQDGSIRAEALVWHRFSRWHKNTSAKAGLLLLAVTEGQ